MSSLDKSTLMNEVYAIVNSRTVNEASTYEAKVIVGDIAYPTYKIISLDIVRDYGTSYADKVMLEVVMPGGYFLKNVLPFKEDLKVQLSRQVRSTHFDASLGNDTKTTVYRATLVETNNQETASSNPYAKADAESLNLMDLRKVTFQLQDLVIEQLRFVTLGTVVRQATPTELVRGLLNLGNEMVQVADEQKVKGIHVVPADNDELQTHSIIPHGTKLVDIPDIIQNKLCGLYSSGLGFYLQDALWYIWPLYNFNKFDDSAKTVTVILLPSNKMPGIEKTYRLTANQVVIIVTGGTVHYDDSEEQILNYGNGVRYADSRRLIEGFGTVKGNKVQANRTNNASEFVGVNRASKLNNIQRNTSNNNIYKQASSLAARNGSKMMVNWQNSDPDLITPAMGCQVIFERNGLPITLKATIVGTHTSITTADGGIKTTRQITNTAISLFVEKDLPELKEYVQTGKVDQYSKPL